jgi:propionyl-CoA synthetase
MVDVYDEIYARSLSDPAGFWGEAAAEISWSRPYETVLDTSRSPFTSWFRGGQLNTCYNALDRHLETRGNQPALVYVSVVTDTVRSFTYSELTDSTARFAGALQRLGVTKGDRVVIYMPMVPEAVVAMLACARLGAIHSVVFGGFAATELATRINHSKPKVIVSCSCGIEGNRIVPYKPMLDGAIEQASTKPTNCIILQRPQERAELVKPRDVDWNDAVAESSHIECVPVESGDPLYILYTSGTTGNPKGVVRDNGGHAVALKWTMRNFYGIDPGEVFWAASDIGWQVGHSYTVYGPLFHGATSILFEGKPVGTPDAGVFWRVIEEQRVAALFTAPTAIRAIRREDPDGQFPSKYNLSGFRALFLAGERCDPDTLRWAEEHLRVPVVDHWWQTESGWPIAGNPLGIQRFPTKYGSTARALPGWDVRCVEPASGAEVAPGESGSIVIKLPLAPGALTTLWDADDRFVESYMTTYPGFYDTRDAGYIDEDKYIYIMARVDDVINVAGHRLSTGAMEEVLASHESVAECAVVGVADELKGQVPLGLLVLKSGVTRSETEVVSQVVQLVRERIGPVAFFKQAVIVDRLPKTRSGKILRGTIQAIAEGREWRMPATIEDSSAIQVVTQALHRIGYGAPHGSSDAA